MTEVKINICGDLVITEGNFPDLENDIIDYFSKGDLNIVNLECPITKSNNKIEKTGLHLKGDEYGIFNLLKKLNINLVTLANNHIFDYGVDGLNDTISFCKKNDLNYVGAGLFHNEISKSVYYNLDGKKITFLNFAENEWANSVNGSPGANSLDVINNVYQIKKEKNKADIVIVIIHGGNEYYNLPSPKMQKTYRFYADNGADLIVGHHPHCISGYELYNNIPIFYSLGNFLFTKKSNHDSWYRGMILSIIINQDNNISFDIKYTKQSKDNYSLSFVDNFENEVIRKEIENLNSIILDETLMLENWKDYLKKIELQYLRAFSPLNGIKNRIIKKLIIKVGLDKIFINKSHYFSLLNYIRCEAHLEVSQGVLKEFTKK
ncbi:CapA family protein [Flavobacterium cyclinae]|uniref:CapA family protein n=1 Tax=Flavobacterium cyclinae TaxID=2895947 RepID=UPI001E4E4AC8|nr:CapA family protein [Flavobacterium cyclinae]UGS20600.1 CapA family protein [Flavobacterium cyclinae]